MTDLAMTPNTVSAADTGSTYSADAAVQGCWTESWQIRKRRKTNVSEVYRKRLTVSGEHVRTGETTMGRAVTSAYLLETGADIAIENAGGIRAGIDEGGGDLR